MRRALQTCYNIFKNYANPPKVIVHPALRECLKSNCDIGSSVDILRKEFPDYDFSLLNNFEKPHLWFINDIPKDMQNEVFSEINRTHPNLEDEINNAQYLVLEKIKKMYPIEIEPQTHLNRRVQEVWVDIKRRVVEEKAKTNAKIMIIGHSRFFETSTAESFGNEGEPVGAKWLKNCEVYEFSINNCI